MTNSNTPHELEQGMSVPSWTWWIAVVAVAVCGCSGSEYPLANVSGVVALDGQPLEGAKLVFSPKGDSENPYPGPKSIGKTDAEGRFQLITRDGDSGAVVGNHRVRITTLLQAGDPDNPFAAITVTPEKVPTYYTAKSMLDTEVPAEGLDTLRFDLKSKPGKN